jgi:hypothetical protein
MSSPKWGRRSEFPTETANAQSNTLHRSPKQYVFNVCDDCFNFWLRRIGAKARYSATPEGETAGGDFPFENMALKIKDNYLIIGWLLRLSSVATWETRLFYCKNQKGRGNQEMV